VPNGPYKIEWDAWALGEFDRLRAFEANGVERAIDLLEYQAEIETRNRKPLDEHLDEIPQASWELRVGAHRVFYDVRSGEDDPSKTKTVRILRVIFKGRQTTQDAVGRKP